jgi:cellulose synthase/poly-beta-1,6-N-acetylglucosamine synthase-like glycosyltransferase
MDAFFDIFFLFCVIAMVFYIITISLLSVGWLNIPYFKSGLKPFEIKVSIIIPARNEEKNIADCINHILGQNFPKELFEIIVVDDHSEDNTRSIVETLISTNNCIKIISSVHSEKNASFKKEAIEQGIMQSSGDLIITTDADCVMKKNWLSTIVSFYQEKKPEMIIAPVAFHNEISIFERMQSLEFAGLILTGAGSSYFNSPVLCNGANLAYSKRAFLEAGGFAGILQNPSGDDVLLMFKFSKLFPGKIKFLKSREAVVYTNPVKSIKSFLNQRSRWASKSLKNASGAYIFTSFIVLFVNLLIVLTLIFGLFSAKYFKIFGFLFAGKCLFDFLLLFLSASFFNKKQFLWYFIPEQMLYSFYILIAGVSGLFNRYEWKGRRGWK